MKCNRERNSSHRAVQWHNLSIDTVPYFHPVWNGLLFYIYRYWRLKSVFWFCWYYWDGISDGEGVTQVDICTIVKYFQQNRWFSWKRFADLRVRSLNEHIWLYKLRKETLLTHGFSDKSSRDFRLISTGAVAYFSKRHIQNRPIHLYLSNFSGCFQNIYHLISATIIINCTLTFLILSVSSSLRRPRNLY